MSDHSVNGLQHRHHHKVPKLEYRIYFAAIFVAALPFTFVATVADLATGRDTKDPVRRALAEARAITPHIFSA